MSNNFFRASCGAIILSADNMVLGFERAKQHGSWQFPQGGIDGSERPRQAIVRELAEESGLQAEKQLDLIAEHPDWLSYELPLRLRNDKIGRGQTQKWFIYRAFVPNIVIDLTRAASDEFRDYRWLTMEQMLALVVDFKRPLYVKLHGWLNEILER